MGSRAVVSEGISGAPRHWRRTLPIPHPPRAVEHPAGVVPAALGSRRCPHQRCPVPAGERWHAGPFALPCPARGLQHARPPTGSPRAPRCGRGCGLGSGAGLARLYPALSRCQAGEDRPQALLCASHVGLGVWFEAGGAHPPVYLYLWGGWGAATSAQVPLKAPRKWSPTGNLRGDSSARAGDVSWGCSEPGKG